MATWHIMSHSIGHRMNHPIGLPEQVLQDGEERWSLAYKLRASEEAVIDLRTPLQSAGHLPIGPR